MRAGVKREGYAWFKALVVGLILYIIIRTFFLSNYVVQGESMMPTLADGNKVVVNKVVHELERFDIIIFHHDDRDDFVKRIIGLPGDQIAYYEDELYLNGRMITEPFLEERKKSLPLETKLTGDFTLEEVTGETTVPEGMLFVMGDNRVGSWDGRHFGFISIEQVVGKVNLCYWPISELNATL